jgi:hypothetical protein
LIDVPAPNDTFAPGFSVSAPGAIHSPSPSPFRSSTKTPAFFGSRM